MPEFLSIEKLSKRYGSGPFVIKDFSKTISQGTVVGLTGANGSGKTTFLRLLATSAFPTSGTIHFRGFDIHKSPRKFLQHIGQATDVSNLPEYLNAEEVLEWILRARDLWESDSPARINRIFEQLELDERRKELIGTYSSGMMQKTLIASAIIAQPEIVVLDEPFRALDESSKASSIALLKSFADSGGTILISSHQKESLEMLCHDYINFPLNQQDDS